MDNSLNLLSQKNTKFIMSKAYIAILYSKTVPSAHPQPDGAFEPWGEWSECSKTCHRGKQARVRTCSIPDGADFMECIGFLREVRDCNVNVSCTGNTHCHDSYHS